MALHLIKALKNHRHVVLEIPPAPVNLPPFYAVYWHGNALIKK
jgi:hypothetical protein